MSRWYRAYPGTVNDPKISEAAVVAETSRSVVIAVWHSILESCASVNEEGRFDTTARRVAASLGEPLVIIERVFAVMEELELITSGAVKAWQKRQYASDTSAERTKRYRERHSDGDVTSQERHVTPPDTDTDTDIKPNGLIANATKPTHRKPKKATRLTSETKITEAQQTYARDNALEPFEVEKLFEKMRNWSMSSADKGAKLDWEATWRNFVIEECSRLNRKPALYGKPPPDLNGKYLARSGSDEWHAWNKFKKATTTKGIPAIDWYVDSQWPPNQPALEAAE